MIIFLIFLVFLYYYFSYNIFFAGLIFFISLIFIIYFYYKKSKKINKNNTIKDFEIKNTIRSLFIYLILIIIGFELFDRKIINFDFSFNFYTLFWFVLFVIFHDAFFYFGHRFMHIPIVYKNSHVVHHKSVFSNIMSAFNFGILEAFIYAIAVVPIFFFDLNFYAMLATIFLNDFANIIGHSGYEIFDKDKIKNNKILIFLVPTTYHDLHHSNNNGNYSLYFSYLDKIFKTEDIKNK